MIPTKDLSPNRRCVRLGRGGAFLFALFVGAASQAFGAAPPPPAKPSPSPPAKPAAPASKPADSNSKTTDSKPAGADIAEPLNPPPNAWSGGSVVDSDGVFAYCVMESRYNNGETLVLGRRADGSNNLGVGRPEGKLLVGKNWTVKLSIDDAFHRERDGAAPEKDFLVVANGRDDELLQALAKGHVLTIERQAKNGPREISRFRLSGTGKAVQDMRQCVENARAPSQSPSDRNASPQAAAETAAAAPPAFPKSLLAILQAAGLKDIQPLPVAPGTAASERPADFVWRYGVVLGGMLENAVSDGRDLVSLTKSYLEVLKAACEGAFSAKPDPIEALPAATLRTASVECSGDKGRAHAALLLYFTRTRLFTVFFHEGGDADRKQTFQARDAIARVIRDLARKPPPPGAP